MGPAASISLQAADMTLFGTLDVCRDKEEKVAELTFNVEGMDCSGCEESIKRSVGNLPGVQEIKADHVSGRVEVSGTGESDETTIREAIVGAGYEVR